ncbi:helix-turn-helix domain-containing protein [Oceanobacillus profundus]|uniref:helix-turn-helix domain-containing protein n=1 Tax=Oceanobacillus profundus TaxID=372463 RepID=UPI0026E3FB53|nr:helix-turn-helix transcriptional regulator [Oceanobacillus profundus]MDO6451888.1 helix-turn-helix transcriptional regulator [Oceanobacillus profundus]
MNEKEIAVYVGKRIKEERKKNKMTQKELGEKIGVKHNTISSYESGVNAPEQNAIFKIARALDVKVDDLFPSKDDNNNGLLEKALNMSDGNLELKHIEFLNQLVEKTLSFEGEEREKFLQSIKFTVDYHEKMNKND